MSYLQELYHKQHLLGATEAMPVDDLNQRQGLEQFLSLSLQESGQTPHQSTYISLEEIDSNPVVQQGDDHPSPAHQPIQEAKNDLKEEESNKTKTHFKTFGLHPLELTVLNERDQSTSKTDLETKQALYQSLTSNSLSSDIVIRDLLGAGGMGMVFGGIQNCLNREVAFKISRNYKQMTPQLLAQVCHEAQITAQLSHARIHPVYLLALTPKGEPIQVMKKIEGVPWTTLLKDKDHPFWDIIDVGELNNQHAQSHYVPDHVQCKNRLRYHLRVLLYVSQAMAYAHTQGVIHRDLKPDNIMVGSHGEIYILDWGVALYLDLVHEKSDEYKFHPQKISGIENALVGTPVYMPPEMAIKKISKQGPWTDVFQLGAMLYQLWTNKHIYDWESVSASVLFQQIEKGDIQPLPEDLPAEAKLLIFDALAHKVEHRIQNAHEFAKRLDLLIQALESRKMEAKGRDKIAYAKQLIEQQQSNLGHDEVNLHHEIDQALDEARYLFWSATHLWPANKSAEHAIDEVLELWVPNLISRSELSCAQRLLNSVQSPAASLTEMWQDSHKISQREAQNLKKKTLPQGHSKGLIAGLVVSCCTSLILGTHVLFGLW